MSATSYQQYHHELLEKLAKEIKSAPPFNDRETSELQAVFLQKLDEMVDGSIPSHEIAEQGQWLLSTIVSHYQLLMPTVPRSLFWYFGGDCLHYLGDEEIHRFQQLDEAFHDAIENGQEGVSYENLIQNFEQEDQSMLH